MTAVNDNSNDKNRKVGFELEYAGVNLLRSAEMLTDLFGGEIVKHSRAEITVANTELGDFRLELDAEPVKKMTETLESVEPGDGPIEELYHKSAKEAVKIINNVGAKVVPYEIVMPPIAISDIKEADKIRQRLHDASARGTREAVHYAFGLHINPEVKEETAEYLLAHIRAFALLTPWLQKAHDVDLTRKLSAFAQPYTKAYIFHIFGSDYRPDLEKLITDYHYYNPSRNKALDMLPVFAHLNEKLVRKLYGEEEKINARPTFHYRLPNCDLSQQDWTLMQEWKRWLRIEEVAADKEKMSALLDAWRKAENSLESKILSSDSSYIRKVEDVIGGADAA